MRQAVIMNSVALTLNTIVMILQFLFIPITMISDGLLTFEYFLKYKTISFILSYGAILTHFVFIRFTMIKKDYQWVIATLGIWAFFNLTADSDGLFFSQMNGAKNLVKIAMASYFIMASTCLFFVLCQLSQKYQKVQESKEFRKLLKQYGQADYEDSTEEEDEEEEEEENQNDKGIVPLVQVEDVDQLSAPLFKSSIQN